MSKKASKKPAAPQKLCPNCGSKVHVRSKVCACGFDFAQGAAITSGQLVLSEPVVTAVLQATRLVNQIGEQEALRLIRRVAAELNASRA